MSNVTRVPVAEGLFTCSDGPPRLIASRHRETGAISFPAEQATDRRSRSFSRGQGGCSPGPRRSSSRPPLRTPGTRMLGCSRRMPSAMSSSLKGS